MDHEEVGYAGEHGGTVPTAMPNHHDTERTHHIPKMRFQVANRTEYNAGLRRRRRVT